MTGTTVKTLRVLLNRAAGSSGKDELAERLQSRNGDAAYTLQVDLFDSGENLTEQAARVRRTGCDVLAAGGGDGTLNAVAQALAGTETALGVLPVGTWNHFARDLSIPLDGERAAEILMTGAKRRVDIGEVNGRVFINNAIIGWYPLYRFHKDTALEQGSSRFGAVAKALWTLARRNPYLTVRLLTDGKEMVRKTPYVLVANNRHQMEGYQLGTRQTLVDGQLWVYVMRRQDRLGLLRLLLSVGLGRFKAADEMEVFPASALRIETRRRKLGVSVDGEIVMMTSPLDFSIRPKALKVVVPPAAHAVTAPEE